MSLYPDVSTWTTSVAQCVANSVDMVNTYGRPVMIVEIGMPQNQPVICRQFISTLIANIRGLPNGMGQGVMYWEPEGYTMNYGLTAWQTNGRPTSAMKGFLR